MCEEDWPDPVCQAFNIPMGDKIPSQHCWIIAMHQHWDNLHVFACGPFCVNASWDSSIMLKWASVLHDGASSLHGVAGGGGRNVRSIAITLPKWGWHLGNSCWQNSRAWRQAPKDSEVAGGKLWWCRGLIQSCYPWQTVPVSGNCLTWYCNM